ncbi:TIGR03089 family protein [Georgenia sp. 311]|uniref:TIGR03089 family protein n=1 Tax=Georgenia sp. 311 TaxID=2585134 RepID=UPI001111EB89|nr:TIGR03089 family protein [Georgenia sp. 311]TNC17162.1 TIGR03089 family protein [Georgenia sp. 311]
MSIATKVLDLLTGDEPNQPRLTWYGPDDERVELSGRVLANWVTKATNLLVEEGEVGPGTRVLLDVPVHWRALVWAMATWCAGGELVLPPEEEFEGDRDDDDDPYEPEPLDDEEPVDEDEESSVFLPDADPEEPDIAVTSRAGDAPSAGMLLVVALPALAMQVDEPIPAGAVDAAAALMGYGDVLDPVEEPAPSDPALSGPEVTGSQGGPVTYGELADWCRDQTPASHRDEERPRVLCSPGSRLEMLAHAVAAWRAGGSLVLLGEDVDSRRFAPIGEAERVTVRC